MCILFQKLKALKKEHRGFSKKDKEMLVKLSKLKGMLNELQKVIFSGVADGSCLLEE